MTPVPVGIDPIRLALILVAAMLGGVVNAIAGGGTLITFPALVGLGIPSVVANATSTMALWPGAAAGAWGYRGLLNGMETWVTRIAVPSLLGGLVGAGLLLITPANRFDAIVPWLILGATLLFVFQRTLAERLGFTGAARAKPTVHADDPQRSSNERAQELGRTLRECRRRSDVRIQRSRELAHRGRHGYRRCCRRVRRITARAARLSGASATSHHRDRARKLTVAGDTSGMN